MKSFEAIFNIPLSTSCSSSDHEVWVGTCPQVVGITRNAITADGSSPYPSYVETQRFGTSRVSGTLLLERSHSHQRGASLNRCRAPRIRHPQPPPDEGRARLQRTGQPQCLLARRRLDLAGCHARRTPYRGASRASTASGVSRRVHLPGDLGIRQERGCCRDGSQGRAV